MTKKKPEKAKRVRRELTASGDVAASYLEEVAKGLRAGTVSVGESPDQVVTSFTGDVDVEVETKRSKRKARIEISIAFRADEPAEVGSDANATKPAPTLPDEMTF
jgi:amphi-Trp domain-containing protein